MLQTHTDFDQAETEQLKRAEAKIKVLHQVLQDIHLVVHRFDWGSYTTDTPEGYVYRRVKEGLE
ncbi:hypothetical protein [Ornithinibacillus xuwenensis]|uniref:Uncharacterized protein n=1 Tax=Ornithinibacillus xuwenensis TaxID=3144668 RepID=A0ABU9XDW3_9BACI